MSKFAVLVSFLVALPASVVPSLYRRGVSARGRAAVRPSAWVDYSSGSDSRPSRSSGRVYISTFWPGCGCGQASFGRSQ
jgi:hypothetical protein